MKKVSIILFVLLSIGIIPLKTFAQGDPGGGNNEKPAYILNCKRNNGNGTSAGTAEVRLNFTDKIFHNVTLLDIRNLDGTSLPKEAVMDGIGKFEKGYMSYALFFNIPPTNKLFFHFKYDNGDFWIPEM